MSKKKKNKFKQSYFRELKRYSFGEIKSKLSLTNDECDEIIKKLKYADALKVVKKSNDDITLTELADEQLTILEENLKDMDVFFTFSFVGVITINQCIIISYPKYLKDNEMPEEEVKQVLKVLRKYSSKEQIINFYNGEDDEKNFNKLALILYIINDFYDNGLYSNHKEMIEVNGEGEILWEKTINETYAFLCNNRPYYLEIFTKNSEEDQRDYFNRLHKAILGECFISLSEARLDNLFEITITDYFEEEIEQFGDKDYILYRIERELSEQFVTQKQMMLKCMYTYIANKKSGKTDLGLSLYGSTSFNLVWEKVCASVLNDRLNTKIKDLPGRLSEKYVKRKESTLMEIIEKPKWTTYEDFVSREASSTLTPDLITIEEHHGKLNFSIFDGKYYDMKFTNKTVSNQPGVSDVTKQYLYQLAYSDFIKDKGYDFTLNAFLVPSEREEIENQGQVEMSILYNIEGINMKNIEIIKLPAKKMYDLYLNNRKLPLSEIITALKHEEIRRVVERILEEEDILPKEVMSNVKVSEAPVEYLIDKSVSLDAIVDRVIKKLKNE